ncbi:MAG: hypothetical protein HC867_07665, partial [Bacteroidia bacterium]|nr:hypothetical protein [Bacteroidia bacterium]
VLVWSYSIKGTLGNLDWVNTQKWPNPKLMIDSFRVRNNLKSILITEPFILQDAGCKQKT